MERRYMFKKGFTLAEVLVTLGIIGVVAAMTIPALIRSYNKQLVETRLKKFYSVFNQAILQSVHDNGPFEGWEYWIEQTDENGNAIPNQPKIRNAFDRYLRPYMNIVNTREGKCRTQVSDDGKCTYYYMVDGSVFTFSEHISRTVWYYPKGDWERCEMAHSDSINGVCLFVFTFNPLYKQSAWKYHFNRGLEPFLFLWNGTEERLLNHPTYGCAKGNGAYCAGLIQYYGWHIPKHYPREIKY